MSKNKDKDHKDKDHKGKDKGKKENQSFQGLTNQDFYMLLWLKPEM